MVLFLFIISIVIFVLIHAHKKYESFLDVHSEYPCRTVLSDRDFLKHMIPHHQIAIDISIEHIKNTKSDIIQKILRELIWTQKYEILLMNHELNHKMENVSNITSNQPFIPTFASYISPNVIGLTNTYCDPTFFSVNAHHNTHQAHSIRTDREYILHMIPHHQVAVDMCKILLQHTKSDFLIYLAYRLIQAQEAEIILLNNLLKSKFIS